MKNKFKTAGIWNIACGVAYSLAYVGVYVLFNIGLIMGSQGTGEEALGVALSILATIVGVYLWEVFMMFPFFMILTGVEMCSKHKKGVGVKILIVFNALFKLLAGAIGASIGFIFLLDSSLIIVGCGIFFVLVAVLLLVSIIMDFRALFSREKVA